MESLGYTVNNIPHPSHNHTIGNPIFMCRKLSKTMAIIIHDQDLPNIKGTSDISHQIKKNLSYISQSGCVTPSTKFATMPIVLPASSSYPANRCRLVSVQSRRHETLSGKWRDWLSSIPHAFLSPLGNCRMLLNTVTLSPV